MKNDFGPPFNVEIKPDTYRTILTVNDAIDVLLLKWPERATGQALNDVTRVQALTACWAALEGRGSAKRARRLFIEAAWDQGVSRCDGLISHG